MKHVYLSLAEGVTDFNKAKRKQKLINLTTYSNNLNAKVHQIINTDKRLLKDIKANHTNSRLTNNKAKLLDVPIQTDRLPKEYSAGGVVNIKYSLSTIKSMTNSELLNDLNIMCRIYNKVLSAEQTSSVKHVTKQAEIKNKYDFNNIPLTKVSSTSTSNKPMHRTLQPNTNKKPNYIRQNKKNMREGNAGEVRVKKYEQDHLKDAGKTKLAKKVHQLSKSNDRLGYDVLSFNTDGTPLYIEVKTTPTNNGDSPFPMSWRELSVARKYPKNYRVYRIYNAKRHRKSKNDHLWFKVYKYSDLAKMEKHPESYIVNPGNKN